jgi:hypothetical protein
MWDLRKQLLASPGFLLINFVHQPRERTVSRLIQYVMRTVIRFTKYKYLLGSR